jgi:Ser/Thr protein kinase RdoA (MazF antagonist)
VTALATIHDAWQSPTRVGRCPALERRAARAGRWQMLLASGWEPRYRKELHPVMNVWAERAWPIVRERVPGVPGRLRPWFDLELPLQPCLCDIWHDHVLYSGDSVTGIVDYGSVRTDHVAVDLARLIGSMAGNEQALRTAALTAYCQRRRLSTDELALIDVLDETGTLLGAANWLMWVYHDGREFADMEKAALRLAALVQRLS